MRSIEQWSLENTLTWNKVLGCLRQTCLRNMIVSTVACSFLFSFSRYCLESVLRLHWDGVLLYCACPQWIEFPMLFHVYGRFGLRPTCVDEWCLTVLMVTFLSIVVFCGQQSSLAPLLMCCISLVCKSVLYSTLLAMALQSLPLSVWRWKDAKIT